MLRRLNEVYANGAEPAEKGLLKGMKAKVRRTVKERPSSMEIAVFMLLALKPDSGRRSSKGCCGADDRFLSSACLGRLLLLADHEKRWSAPQADFAN